MAEPQEEPEWMKEFYKKVMKNSGLTPGNDEYLTLECGHEVAISVPHSSTYVYKVGEECFCSTCADSDEKKEEP